MMYEKDIERFFQNVQKTSSCWIWLGKRDQNGYGLTWIDGKFHYSHEISFQIENGSIPIELVVNHTCQIKLCVNPDHLFLSGEAQEIQATKFLESLDPMFIQNKKEFVYFIQSENNGPIKIGWSKNPINRLKQLQRSSPFKLELLFFFPGNKSIEQKLHGSFSRFCIISEWFYPSPEIYSFIQQLRSVDFKEVQPNLDWELSLK